MGSELGLTADSKPAARLNGIGIWWICWTTGWTLLLLWGMGFLIYQRRMPMLRIRGIGLSLSAISLLHLFWISVQLGYVLGPLYPGDTQYWIMSTYLPLGIGLFHASNTRFLHVAQRQKQYIDRADVLNASTAAKLSDDGGILSRFRRLDHTTKVVILVGSRANNGPRSYSWQSSCFSSPANGIVHGASQAPRFLAPKWSKRSKWAEDGNGEFVLQTTSALRASMKLDSVGRLGSDIDINRWPSVLWLLFWAWIVAPFTLWRARDIRDTQGWRTQTIWCAISG